MIQSLSEVLQRVKFWNKGVESRLYFASTLETLLQRQSESKIWHVIE